MRDTVLDGLQVRLDNRRRLPGHGRRCLQPVEPGGDQLTRAWRVGPERGVVRPAPGDGSEYAQTFQRAAVARVDWRGERELTVGVHGDGSPDGNPCDWSL